MVGFYNYTVIATYIGFLSAVFGVYSCSNGNCFYAIICLIICGAIDCVDGAIARTKKNRSEQEKRFGIEIDSLSDLTAFGILPATITYAYGKDTFAAICSSLFALAALIRLAYFDVIAHEKLNEGVKNDSYIGLPVTAVSWVLPIVCGLCAVTFNEINSSILCTSVIALAFMYLIPFKLKKPGKIFVFISVVLSFILLSFLIFEGKRGLL